jgi:hypothetical protein
MLPLLLQSPNEDGSISMIGSMRPLNVTQHHILMDSDFGVAACSLESSALLNVQPESLVVLDKSSRPHISTWIAEWPRAIPELSTDAGTSLLVQQPRDPLAAGVSSNSSSSAETCDGTWIQANLQTIGLPASKSVHVLHWHRMPLDAFSVNKAAQKRRSSLEGSVAIDASAIDAASIAATASAIAVPTAFLPPVLETLTSPSHVRAPLAPGSGATPAADPLRSPGTTAPSSTPLLLYGQASGSAAPPGAGVHAIPQAHALRRSTSDAAAAAVDTHSVILQGLSGGSAGGRSHRRGSATSLASVPAARAATSSGGRRGSDTSGSSRGIGASHQSSRGVRAFGEVAGSGEREDDRSSATSAMNGHRLQRKLRESISKSVSDGTLIPSLRILRGVALLLASLATGMAIGMSVYVFVLMGNR